MTYSKSAKHGSAGTDALHAIAAVGVAALVLYITGIGCPIKFVTGISCPGCGMTRAWLAALSLRFDLALAYHPLFWMVPAIVALVAFGDRLSHRARQVILVASISAFVLVWVVRLVLPHETNVLFSGLLTTDVVSIEVPTWLAALRSLIT